MRDEPIGPRSLTIVIPAYCEEKRLAQTTEEVIAAARLTLDRFEVVIVDDGSTDRTGEIADELTERHDCVSTVHLSENRGVGAAFQAGLARAQHPNISIVPGDHAFEQSGLEVLFGAVGLADMIISYRTNFQVRTPIRRAFSTMGTLAVRLTTRCWLKDGQSIYVWPVDLARQIKTPPDYRYHPVTLVSLLRMVPSFAEVPVTLTPDPDRQSRALRWRTVFNFGWQLSRLLVRSLLLPPTLRPRRVDVAVAIRRSMPSDQ